MQIRPLFGGTQTRGYDIIKLSLLVNKLIKLLFMYLLRGSKYRKIANSMVNTNIFFAICSNLNEVDLHAGGEAFIGCQVV